MESGCEHSSSLRSERSGRKSRPHSEDRYCRRTWAKRPPRRMAGLCDWVTCVNVYDMMAGKNSSREKILEEISRAVNSFVLEYIPITTKDKARVHQFGKKKLKGFLLGCVSRARRGSDANYEDLQESETAEIHVKKFKKTCAMSSLKLLGLPDHHRLQHWLSTSRTQRKTRSQSIGLKRKSRGRCSGLVLCARRGWSGDLLVADYGYLQV